MGRIPTCPYSRRLRRIHLSRLRRSRFCGCLFRFRAGRSGHIGRIFLIGSCVSRSQGINHDFRRWSHFLRRQNMDGKPLAINNYPFRGRFLGRARCAEILSAPAELHRSLLPAHSRRMLPAQRCKLTVPASTIRTLLKPYHAVPPEICDKIQSYMDLLSMWGKKIALTTISSEEDVVRFHFGESIFALSLESFEHGRLADVGSGAGFPGLAIKLLRPNLHVTLLEPNKKKCAFLNEVARKLQLSDVDVFSVPFEASRIPPNELSFVTSRALGRIGDLLSWSRSTLNHDGRVILWLGAEDAESTTRISDWHWIRSAIPGTARRTIIAGTTQNKGGTTK